MFISRKHGLNLLFQPQGVHPDLRWGIGATAGTITEGPGAWDLATTSNWHMELAALPKAAFYEKVKIFFGADGKTGAGAVGTGIVDVQGDWTVKELQFDQVFGTGAYKLRNNSLRLMTGNVTVNNTAGAQIESDIVGTSGLNKYGAGELRLPSASAAYSYSGPTRVHEGTVNLSGTFEYLPNSDTWNIDADFTGTIGLANSGRMIYGANPELTGKTINIVLSGTTAGRWDCGRWAGTLGGTLPTFQVNGATITGVNIGQQFFKYLTADERVFYYNPLTGTGAGYVGPAYGIINDFSQAFWDNSAGPGSWTVPADVYVVRVLIAGGGGGGGGSPKSNIGTASGGAGGGTCWRTIRVLPGQVINYNLGAGGGASNNNPGGGGGDSTATGPDGLNLFAPGGNGGARRQNGSNSPPTNGAPAGTGGDGGSVGGSGGGSTNWPGGGGACFNGDGGGGGQSTGGSGGTAQNIARSYYMLGLAGIGSPLKGGKGPGCTGGCDGLPGAAGCGGGAANSANTAVHKGGRGGAGFILITY